MIAVELLTSNTLQIVTIAFDIGTDSSMLPAGDGSDRTKVTYCQIISPENYFKLR